MGQYLSCSLITKMKIRRGNYCKEFCSDQELMQSKEKIIREIEREFNLGIYNIDNTESEIILTLKEEVLQKHIYDLLNEFLNYDNDISFIYYQLEEYDYREPNNFVINNKVDEKKYKFTLDKNKDYMLCNNQPLKQLDWFYADYVPILFSQKFKYFHYGRENGILLDIWATPFWMDCDKYNGEDERTMLRFLNVFSRKAVQNPLKDALCFCILD